VFITKKRGKGVVLVLFLMILGIVIGYSYGYLIEKFRDKGSGNDELQINKAGMLPDSMENITLDKQAIEPPEVVSAETLFVFRRHYKLCGHDKEHERYATLEEVGLPEDEVKLLHPEWRITEFSSSRVLLTKEIDVSCPDHYLIKEKDGYVAVFQSIENGEGVLMLCQTRMNVAFLETDTRNQVREGIIVDSLEDVENLIESWDS